MSEETPVTPVETAGTESPAPAAESAAEPPPAPKQDRPERTEARGPRPEGRPPRPEGQRPEGGPRGDRPPRPPREGGPNGPREGNRDGGNRREGGRGPGPDDRRGGGPPRDRRPEPMADIDLEKLIADSLYLDNQAHAIVGRLRDMDSGTKSQLRRFYNALRRACRAPEGERQHEFVMLRARLAYTNARHSLRSLDTLEKLLLQVTRKNELRGYERFRDLFEAIVAYNE